MFYLMIGVLLPMTLVTSILFVKARQRMKYQAVGNITQRTQAVAGQVDELLFNIQNVSSVFAYDEEINEVINKSYDENSMEKQRDIYEITNYFYNADPFSKNQRISALYTKTGQVFNFLEPDFDQKEIGEQMLLLGAKDKKKISMFFWYPLQRNFLKRESRAEDVRGQAVIGMRRILHPFTGNWLYTQFFALEERKLYSIYQESVKELGGVLFLVDKNGGLISSSDENTVKKGSVSRELIALAEKAVQKNHQVKYGKEFYIMDLNQLKNADWSLILMIPVSEATAPVDRLFKEIILVMALCIIACVAIITWISKRFLQPVEVLDASMKEVYDGNLEAYVDPDSYNGEIKSMMTYYNAMLVKINHYITEQVESEKKKKELELEVLMGQINPHFLYNTLENIVWKSSEVGRPDIGRIAASLGRLYRLSIGNGETIVPIRQEVEHVMAYVNIQKNRYKERMEFELSVDYDKVWEYSMIKLTLQPVVENCFMYAMEGIDHVLSIRLDVRERQDYFLFRVADNGCGMTKKMLLQVREQMDHGKVRTEEKGRRKHKGTGIGLYSVKERIAIYTGCKDSVKIASKAGFGTIITIRVPKIKAKDKNSP